MADEKAKTLSVKLHMDVIESARIVAAIRNVSMTDMLSDMLRPDLVRMEREELAKRTAVTKQAAKPEITTDEFAPPKPKENDGGFKPGNVVGKRRLKR